MALVGSPVMQALQARSQKLLLQVDTKVGQLAGRPVLLPRTVPFLTSLCWQLASRLCLLLGWILQAAPCRLCKLSAAVLHQPVGCGHSRVLTPACPQVDSLCSTAGYWLWPSSYRAHQALSQGLQLDSNAFARGGKAHDLEASQPTSSSPAGKPCSVAQHAAPELPSRCSSASPPSVHKHPGLCTCPVRLCSPSAQPDVQGPCLHITQQASCPQSLAWWGRLGHPWSTPCTATRMFMTRW